MKNVPGLVLGAALLAAAPARAVSITYYPQAAIPYYLSVAANGAIYFTDPFASKLGHQVPDGAHSAGSTPDSMPFGLVGGLDGYVWIAEQSPPKIVRYNARNFLFPFLAFDVPSTPSFVTFGPDGNLWFTEKDVNKIARMTPAGAVTEFSTGITSSAGLYKLTVGPDNAIWFTELGSPHVGRISATGVVSEFATAGGTFGIGLGPDGNVWFTEPIVGKIGRVTPMGTVTEFPLTGYLPYSIVAGTDGNLWFTFNTTNTTLGVGRITPAGAVKLFPIDTAHGSALDIVAGPDGAVWFSTEGGDLGRISFSGDVNGDADVGVSDVFFLINYLFAGGPAPL